MNKFVFSGIIGVVVGGLLFSVLSAAINGTSPISPSPENGTEVVCTNEHAALEEAKNAVRALPDELRDLQGAKGLPAVVKALKGLMDPLNAKFDCLQNEVTALKARVATLENAGNQENGTIEVSPVPFEPADIN